ncbi:MAG: S-layer homology domain-containing protein, partial [Solibacillus sp.]
MTKINKSRKFFATTATAALVASAIVPVASAANYTDADKIAPWATEAVEFLSEKEVIGGNPDGSFNPRGNITRGEAAKMFTAALELSEEGTEDFKDVFEKDWYYGPIVAVSNAGIVNGKGAGLFAPKANLTRAEAAKMIVEAYGLTGEADLSSFSDAKTVSGKWSEEYLSTAVANGVINGKDGKLAANDSITRQEFAVMFKRAIDVAEEVDYAAELANALADLEKATKALEVEVKIETIAETKAAVATAKTAITTAQAALDAAVNAGTTTPETAKVVKEQVITAEEAAKAQATITAATELVVATEAKIAKVEEAAKELTVESITATSATQVAIKFTKAVNKETLFANGIKGALATTHDTVSIKSLDGVDPTFTGELSKDGKTLVLTTNVVLEKRYDFTVKGLKSTDGKKLKEHKQMVTIEADTTAPTIL